MSLWNAGMDGVAAALRSRLSLQDAFIMAAALCAATLFALEYKFFENAYRMTSHERRITVQEFFGLTGLLIVGLIVFRFGACSNRSANSSAASRRNLLRTRRATWRCAIH